VQGTPFGRYRLIELLGRMGDVRTYEAANYPGCWVPMCRPWPGNATTAP